MARGLSLTNLNLPESVLIVAQWSAGFAQFAQSCTAAANPRPSRPTPPPCSAASGNVFARGAAEGFFHRFVPSLPLGPYDLRPFGGQSPKVLGSWGLEIGKSHLSTLASFVSRTETPNLKGKPGLCMYFAGYFWQTPCEA